MSAVAPATRGTAEKDPSVQDNKGHVPSPARHETPLQSILARIVHVERNEIAALLLSFAYFFLVLAAYYIIRPVRDEMGVAVGRDHLQTLFVIVFFVMLAAVPVYGWVTSRFAKRLVVPLVYSFFILNLIAFWTILSGGGRTASIASVFFVWASVFNLFVVSLFWIVMSDLYDSGQAKRLYGFIAAGGTAGAMAGPIITQGFVRIIGPDNLLLVSAALLTLALVAAMLLRRLAPAHGLAVASERPVGKGILAGAIRVWQSPYLFRIALWILLGNLVSTFFYLEQSHIVGETLTDRTARVELLARLDLAVSIMTILLQVFVTGRMLERFGVGVTAATLPAWCALGLVLLAISPTLGVIVAIMAVERAVAFALASPAVKVLYTVVDPEEKYKAQNFIDTVVYRGGDAASGWVFNTLGKTLGLAGGVVALTAVPAALAWLWLSFSLGNQLKERTASAGQNR
ncbi:MAG: MFS transporter [Hyphomicrobiaceae bacterium]|nr:MFS transporter [Hyphomicrobiaceae bacterium]